MLEQLLTWARAKPLSHLVAIATILGTILIACQIAINVAAWRFPVSPSDRQLEALAPSATLTPIETSVLAESTIAVGPIQPPSTASPDRSSGQGIYEIQIRVPLLGRLANTPPAAQWWAFGIGGTLFIALGLLLPYAVSHLHSWYSNSASSYAERIRVGCYGLLLVSVLLATTAVSGIQRGD